MGLRKDTYVAPGSLADQLNKNHPDMLHDADSPPNCGNCPYFSMQRERDAAREELRLLRESLEAMATRWEHCGGANGWMWQHAGESLREALKPEPVTVGRLLTQLQQAADNRDQPLDRQLVAETVGKLAKLLSTP